MAIIVDKEQKKNEIAGGALELFKKKNFKSVTVNEIARHLGIAKGSIYDYFGSKEELILYTIKMVIEDWTLPDSERILKIEDPEKRLRALTNAQIESLTENDEYIRLSYNIFQFFLDDSVPMRKRQDLYNSTISAGRDLIAGMLTEGVEKGIFKKSVKRNAAKIALNIMAAFDGIAFYYQMNEDKDMLKDHINLYLDSIFGGLKD